MFLNEVGEPTKIKKVIYLITSTILGLFLSLIVHAMIEMSLMSAVLSQGKQVQFYGGCALPPLLQASIWFLGGLGGFMLGRLWWRKVYVERIWLKQTKKKI